MRFIAYLVIAWAVFKFLDSWWASRRKSEAPRRSQGGRRPTVKRQQEVVVNYGPGKRRSSVREDVGEVVEFEEIEDLTKS